MNDAIEDPVLRAMLWRLGCNSFLDNKCNAASTRTHDRERRLSQFLRRIDSMTPTELQELEETLRVDATRGADGSNDQRRYFTL